MKFVYILLYLVSVIAVKFLSTTIREDKLYAISKNDSDNSFHITSYELKNGTIRDIFSSGTSYSLTKLGRGFDLKFFDVPDTVQEARNKLWLKADQTAYGPEIDNSSSNFMGYINLSDMTFKADSSFVKFPTTENFPLFGYTMDTIANDLESALYITGGVIYSKNKDAYISSNSFFKYSFTTKEWKDMSSDGKGKLAPVYNHNSVVVDNKTLVLIGGKVSKDPTKNASLNISEDDLFKANSVYNLTKFDTITNDWESITLNTSMFDASVASIQLTEFSTNFYNNRIFILGGLTKTSDKQETNYNSKVGILDYKLNQWSWLSVTNNDGNAYVSPIEAKSSLLLNDQIVLTSGKPVEKDSDGFQIFNLTSLKIQPTLKFTKSNKDSSYQKNDQSTLPTYAIALIAVGCTVLIVLIILFIYLKCYRNKAKPKNFNTEPKIITEVTCTNTEILNMEYSLYGAKGDSENFSSDINHSGLKLETPVIEKTNNTQEHFTPSPGTANISKTLLLNSPKY